MNMKVRMMRAIEENALPLAVDLLAKLDNWSVHAKSVLTVVAHFFKRLTSF